MYKHHNNTIRLPIQHKAALTTCVHNIAAELLKLVERAVLDPKKEGKPWLREGKFDWYIFKNGYINSGLLMTKKKEEKKVTGTLANTRYTFLGII